MTSFPSFFFCRHARKYFLGLDEDQMPNIQRVMGLLAYPIDTKLPAYQVSTGNTSVQETQCMNHINARSTKNKKQKNNSVK